MYAQAVPERPDHFDSTDLRLPAGYWSVCRDVRLDQKQSRIPRGHAGRHQRYRQSGLRGRQDVLPQLLQ